MKHEKEILEDIDKRGLKVVSFICKGEDGKLVLLSYDDKGLVNFISDPPVVAMGINEKLGGCMIRRIAEIVPPKES